MAGKDPTVSYNPREHAQAHIYENYIVGSKVTAS